MSSYAFFVQTCREEHKKKHIDASLNFSEFSKICSERWKKVLCLLRRKGSLKIWQSYSNGVASLHLLYVISNLLAKTEVRKLSFQTLRYCSYLQIKCIFNSDHYVMDASLFLGILLLSGRKYHTLYSSHCHPFLETRYLTTLFKE